MVKCINRTVEQRSLITVEQSRLIELTIKLDNSRMAKRDKGTVEERSLITIEQQACYSKAIKLDNRRTIMLTTLH
jgi:hypothetical protein